MKVYSISTIPHQQIKTIHNNKKSYSTNQITFGISEHERRVIEKTNDLTKNMGWLDKHVFGGKSKARTQAERMVEREDLEKDKELIRQKTIIEETKKNQEVLNRYAATIEDMRQRDSLRIQALEEAQKGHIQWQKEMFEANQKTTQMISEQIAAFASIMKEMQQMKTESDKTQAELFKQLIEARKANDIDMQKQIEKMREELRQEYEAKYKTEDIKTKKARQYAEMQEKMSKINKSKGFGKVGGYKKEKDTLMTLIGNSIIAEKSGEQATVPNGILFYGPKGNGKSLFARAFAEQLNCHNVKIELDVDARANLTNLRNAAKKAQENFEKDGTRTIIRIEEFDDFAPKDSKIVAPLKSLMDDISQKYHATIFATTNFPEKIDDILLRAGRFDVKVPLAPANKMNTIDIVKHYAQDFADSTVNFEKVAEELVSVQPNEAYSNAKIESVIKKLVTEITELGKTKFSHTDIMNKIKEFGADISKDALNKFADQIILMKKL